MKLIVGITDLKPEWKIALDQIGVNYQLVGPSEKLNKYPVIVISGLHKGITTKSVQEYLQSGGAALTEANIARQILNFKTHRKNLKFIFSADDKKNKSPKICDLFYKTEVVRNANQYLNQDKEFSILFEKYQNGQLIVLPKGFTSLLLNNKITRKNFATHQNCIFANERVSKISKSEIISIIRQGLENLFNSSGLPFIQKWFFPNGEKSLFNFRIDTDFGAKGEVQKLYDVFRRKQMPATWFIEVKSKLEWLNKFNEFENQELALHCYRHKILKSREANEVEIDKGLKALRKFGINPKGYAAPYGEWNSILAGIIEKNNFIYSSEFGLAHDGLPFYSYYDSNFSSVLQVPIHPISINRLQHAGLQTKDLIDYFIYVINRKIENFEPLFFYTHPFEKNIDIIEMIIDEIDKQRISYTSLIDFSQWWINRCKVDWTAEYRDDRINISTENKDDSFWLRIKDSNNEEYLIPLTNGNPERKIPIETHENKFEVINYSDLRKYTFKMFKHDLLFHYRKTKQ